MKRTNGISFSISSNVKKVKQLNAAFGTSNEEFQYTNEIIPFVNSSIALEDSSTLCKRFKSEGTVLAENGRFWEALSKFKKALDYLLPDESNNKIKSILHELCSQCYAELEEIFPAVESAELAVKCNPLCPISFLSLARSQINIGELYLARKNIQVSIHLDPSDSDAKKDLEHIRDLITRLKCVASEKLPIETRPGIVKMI